MNRIETLLCVLAEECAEVAQRCSKAQRFGIHQARAGQHFTNAELIDQELQDVYALVMMLRQEIGQREWFGVPEDSAIEAKRKKVESYMAASPSEISRLDLEDSGK